MIEVQPDTRAPDGATAGEPARWLVSLGLALAVHAAGAAALIAQWSDEPDYVANAPLILVDLAPLAVSPQNQVSDLAPGPVQTESERQTQREKKPVEKLELPQDKTGELQATPKKPEKQKDNKPKRQKQAALSSAPSNVHHQAERAAGPVGAHSDNAAAVSNWMSAVSAAIERQKRYPSDGQGAQGTSYFAFNVDRSGRVHNARIVRGSGSSALDREALATLMRAQPLPEPPANLSGSVAASIRFNVR